MSAFADTSFLCALHVPLSHSPRAIAWYEKSREQVIVAGLVPYEFRQSVRLQIFRHRTDRTAGFDAKTGMTAISQFDANLRTTSFSVVPVEWADVLDLAENLSSRFTDMQGHRSLDILHVATALHLRIRRFLTFDERQHKLAQAAGLIVGP